MATKTNVLDIKASRPFYASVGVTDLAVEVVRDYVADVQTKVRGYQKDVRKNVSGLELKPTALRDQAASVVSTRVDAISKDAKAVNAKVQTVVDDNVAALTGTYVDLVKRGESLVGRIRRQKSTQETAESAATTVAKAKTTRTQATKSARSTASQAKKATAKQAKKATTTVKKSSTAPRSSARSSVTAAKKTASSGTRAVTDAAAKVGR